MKLLRPFAALALGLVLSPWALATPAAVTPPRAAATSLPAAVPSPSGTATAPPPPPALSTASEPAQTPAANPSSASSASPDSPPRASWLLWKDVVITLIALWGAVLATLGHRQARKREQRDRAEKAAQRARDKEREERDRADQAERKASEKDLERRQTALEVARDLDQAWDLLGGRPGTEGIFHLATDDPADLEAARRLIHAALTRDPRCSRAHQVESVYWHAKKRPLQCLESARKAVAVDETNTVAHNILGNALRGQGKFQEAEAIYRRALGLDPEDAVTHTNLGNILGEQGELEAAVASFQKALERDPGLKAAQRNLALALRLQEAPPAPTE